jgi:hypothetical protein
LLDLGGAFALSFVGLTAIVVKEVVAIPPSGAIGVLDSRAILAVHLAIAIPIFGAVGKFDRRAVLPVELPIFVPPLFDAIQVDGQDGFTAY